MKFKIGDRVKFIESTTYHSNDIQIGEVYKIIKIDTSNTLYQIENKEWFRENELELVKYTYEDLKKSPIGTKITFENGIFLIKDGEKYYENEKIWRKEEDLKNLKDNVNSSEKIIKIEEPIYKTVYEYKPEILDETEKRYLKQVIRPFRDRVEYIQKFTFSTGRAKITIKTEKYKDTWYVGLPPFEKDAMYKNMEPDKKYTLEELGL